MKLSSSKFPFISNLSISNPGLLHSYLAEAFTEWSSQTNQVILPFLKSNRVLWAPWNSARSWYWTMSQKSQNSSMKLKLDSQSNQKPNKYNHSSKNNKNIKPFNAKLSKEFKPPFILNYKWTPSKWIKVKLPNPSIGNKKETFMFPIWSSEIKFSIHALFYKEYFDLQEQDEV
jgi:hypothetical protein